MKRGLAVSYEQKVLGLKRLTVAAFIVAFIIGMVTMHIISMPPVWLEEVCHG